MNDKQNHRLDELEKRFAVLQEVFLATLKALMSEVMKCENAGDHDGAETTARQAVALVQRYLRIIKLMSNVTTLLGTVGQPTKGAAERATAKGPKKCDRKGCTNEGKWHPKITLHTKPDQARLYEGSEAIPVLISLSLCDQHREPDEILDVAHSTINELGQAVPLDHTKTTVEFVGDDDEDYKEFVARIPREMPGRGEGA